MKKLLYIFTAIATILAFSLQAHAYELPRCYYQKTGMRYIPTRIYKNTNGTHTCYVNVGGNIKSMGVATLEEPTGIYNNGFMTYENDILLVSTGEILTVTKVNDNMYGTGWCLMNGDTCYPLYNQYGRYLLVNGIIQ